MDDAPWLFMKRDGLHVQTLDFLVHGPKQTRRLSWIVPSRGTSTQQSVVAPDGELLIGSKGERVGKGLHVPRRHEGHITHVHIREQEFAAPERPLLRRPAARLDFHSTRRAYPRGDA